jgi:hypothetical protein
MTSRAGTTWPLSVTALAAAGVAWASPGAPARACSESTPVRHQVAFTAAGVLLSYGAEGRMLRIDAQAATVLSPRLAYRALPEVVGFTPDGRTVLVAALAFEDRERGPSCMATHVYVSRVDVASGEGTRIRRLRAANAESWEVAPDGTRALLMASDSADEPVVHVFDLVTGSRLRVTRDRRGWFLDANTLLVEDPDGSLRIVSAAQGRTLAWLPPARAGETRRLLPGDTRADAFTLVVEREGAPARLVQVRVAGRRVTITPRALRIRGVPLASAAGGTRLLVQDGRAGEGRTVRVLASDTGAELARATTPYRYTAATLSADGEVLGLVSVPRPPPNRFDQPYDMHAYLPTTVERIEIATGARVAWGDGPASVLTRVERPSEGTPAAADGDTPPPG